MHELDSEQPLGLVRELKNLYLDNMMKEREALLVRLGQVEDTLIQHDRLKRRTKPPRK